MVDPPITSQTQLTPHQAIEALQQRVGTVGTESIEYTSSVGRILAEPLMTDRDSPPCDVSSMDGYALQVEFAGSDSIHVSGESVPGLPPSVLKAGHAVRIVTGAPMPEGANVVVPIEQIEESQDAIRVKAAHNARVGQNIRRRGENTKAGSEFAGAGNKITPALVAGLATFGKTSIKVFKKIRVSVINTGQELVPTSASPTPWQIRDSNGPSIAALLATREWIDTAQPMCVPDDRGLIESSIRDALSRSDAILLTGAVSMGIYDQVPDILRHLGCEIIFHRLPLRPGKPVLGAIGPQGQLVFGLPGNPVSALVMVRRMAVPVLAQIGGMRAADPPCWVKLSTSDRATIPLWWYRLVRCEVTGVAGLVDTRGSGDIPSLTRSDGFIEIPPNQSGTGPWPYLSW